MLQRKGDRSLEIQRPEKPVCASRTGIMRDLYDHTCDESMKVFL